MLKGRKVKPKDDEEKGEKEGKKEEYLPRSRIHPKRAQSAMVTRWPTRKPEVDFAS